MASILFVEDDPILAQTVAEFLTKSGHQVSQQRDGLAALREFSEQYFQLVILDVMLPGMNGFDLCNRFRIAQPNLPIILLTARGQEHERINGFNQGADDYVTKPFSMRELGLRINALLRRTNHPESVKQVQLVDGDLVVNTLAQQVCLAAVELELTSREYDLLLWFLLHPKQVFSRSELMQHVWGWQVGDDSTVTVHVRRLREKIETDPSLPTRLVTVFGRGYRWESTDES